MKKKNPTDKAIVDANLSLIYFKENRTHVYFCPELDIIGTGRTIVEAKKSYRTVLKMYIEYVQEHNTLMVDLKKHGWKLDRKTKQMTPPVVTDLIQLNPELKEIFNGKMYNSEKYKIVISA